MATRLLDYDPLTGMSITFDYDQNDQLKIVHSQDVQNSLDFAQSLRNEDDYGRAGIKNDSWHYAHLPYIIIQELKNKHGVNINDMNDRPKLFELLNTEYKDFKLTTLTHTVKHG